MDLHALISHEQYGRNMRLVSVGSEASMLALHAETPVGNGTFYSVRPVDHELSIQAVQAEANRLGKAQRQALRALTLSTQPGQSIQPGSRKSTSTDPRRWAAAGGQYSADATAPLRSLAARGFVTIAGLDFAPKTYRLTTLGRTVGQAL
jgi:hypothetical protein